MYKKIFLLTLVILISTMVSYAQDDRSQQKRAQLEQRKIAYITAELDMTADQAQQFWPIYNKYVGEQTDGRKAKRTKMKEEAQLSESEAKELISVMLEDEEKKVQWKKEYVAQLQGVLDNKQILTLLGAEKKFRKEILAKFKKRRKGGNKGQKDIEKSK